MQCFPARRFGAAGSSPDFSGGFHGMALLGLCLETFFPCTILSYPGQPPPPSSFQGILKMSFLEFQINRFLFSSCFSGNFLLAACILLTGGLFAKIF